MKKLLLLTSMLIFCNYFGHAQCLPRTIPGSTINEFDWTTEMFDVYLKAQNSQSYSGKVVSPFHSIDNTSQVNTDYLAFNLKKDYAPTDGWELIYHNFGTESQSVAFPGFALYNRYNGLFRFFLFLIPNKNTLFREGLLSTYLSGVSGVLYNSALFESQNKLHNALDNFEKNIYVNSVNAIHGSAGEWIVSEWLTHYDPCSCNNELEIIFETSLQNIDNFDMKDIFTDETHQIHIRNGFGNNRLRANFGDVQNSINFLSKNYGMGNEIYDFFPDFLHVNQKDNVTPTQSVILNEIVEIVAKDNNIITSSEAASILSNAQTIVGSSSSPTFTSNFSNHIFGTKTDSNFAPYGAHAVYVPGSNHLNLPKARVPVYDNILGVASIIETPKIEVGTYDEIEVGNGSGTAKAFKESYIYYQFKDDIKYAINGAANINEVPLNKKVAIYFELEYIIGDSLAFDKMEIEELIVVNSKLLRTPYMNLGCLKDYPIEFKYEDTKHDGYKINISPYLSFAMVLESNDIEAKKIAYLKSYKLEQEEIQISKIEVPFNQFSAIDEELMDELVVCEDVLPVTLEYLTNFCTSTKYKAKTLPFVYQEPEPIIIQENIAIYPNPVTGILQIDLIEYESYFYQILNTLGQEVYSGNFTDNILDLSNLKLGTYVLKIFQNNEILFVEKITKL